MPSTPSPTPVPKGTLWTGRVLSALPVLLLVFSAYTKLAQPLPVVQAFVHMGFPLSLSSGLGILELSCTLLYVIPRTSVLGAILLTGYLGGATATTVRIGDPFYLPVLFGIMVWGGLFLRDPRLRSLIPLRS